MEKREGESGQTLARLWILAGLILALQCLTGCAAVLGIKEYQGSDGSRMVFVTGADFRIGANGVDTVDDSRGIKPGVGYAAAKERY